MKHEKGGGASKRGLTGFCIFIQRILMAKKRKGIECAIYLLLWQYRSFKMEVFQNRYLRMILNIFWPNITTNEELNKQTSTQPLVSDIERRRWPYRQNASNRLNKSGTPMDAYWIEKGNDEDPTPEKGIREGSLSWGLLEKLVKDE